MLEQLGEFMAEHKQALAGSRGLGELQIPGAGWARAVEKDGRCHVFISGEQGTLRIAAEDLPAGFDWEAGGIEVELGGEDAAPIAVSAAAAC